MEMHRKRRIYHTCHRHNHKDALSTKKFRDQTSPRTNTLFDDADDIQRQLDNEARDRLKYGRPKAIWVFHFPTYMIDHSALMDTTEMTRRPRVLERKPRKDVCSEEWEYPDHGAWAKIYPGCGGKSQSPVDLPVAGLFKPKGARPMMFQNYDVKANTMSLTSDGKRLILQGEWNKDRRPLIYGGAVHSRRYLFDSLTIHLPAEHTLGGVYFPLETQAFYVSAEYGNMNDALQSAASDPQSLLAVSNIYSFGDHTHKGLKAILNAAKEGFRNGSLEADTLNFYNPPFKEYACYQGSLTTPPCTESVIWLIRGRTMYIERETWEAARMLMNSEGRQSNVREAQPLNDRRVFLFK